MKTLKTQPLYRHFSVDRATVNEDDRTVSLAFSSETPYERYFGIEVLDHTPSSIRMDRLTNGGALLADHDTRKQIGVVERVEIGDDRVGRAIVRFGKSAAADEIFQDVIDGIRRHVSVGYFIHRMVMEEEKDGVETYRVADWEPFEISLVSIPADPTVGIGRAVGDAITTVIETPAEPEPKQRSQEIIIMPEADMQQAEKNGRDAEAQRVNELLALADTYDNFGARAMVADYIRQSKTAGQFREAIMEKMASKHSDAREAEIGMNTTERKRYSILRAVQAQLTGDWSKAGLEREASVAVAKRAGKDPEGFFVPVDAFSVRAFNAGTAGEAGNLIETDLLSNEFVDVLRNAMVLSPLGVRFLGGLTSNIQIPRKASTSTVGWLAETGATSLSGVNTSQINLTPHRVGAHVDYSKQALLQSSLDVEAMLRDDLADTTALEVERAALLGSGASNEPTGLLNTSGVGTIGLGINGAQIDWQDVVELESICANANAEPGARAGYTVNTKTRGWFKTLQKAANLPFVWDGGTEPLNDYRAAVSNMLPNNGTKGTGTNLSTAVFGADWSDLVIALFGGYDVVVDPYTLSTTGEVRITVNQFIDIGVRREASFAFINDAITQ